MDPEVKILYDKFMINYHMNFCDDLKEYSIFYFANYLAGMFPSQKHIMDCNDIVPSDEELIQKCNDMYSVLKERGYLISD